MMWRPAPFLIALLATLIAAIWAFLSPNTITFTGPGFEGATSWASLIFFAFLLVVGTALCWSALTWIGGIPWLMIGSRRARLTQARAALARGMIAVEGGETAKAHKYAQRAEKFLADLPPGKNYEHALALLLTARTAQNSDDWAGAERAYAALAREKGAALAGFRGMAAAAIKRGDTAGAQAQILAAMNENSKILWPMSYLFELQVTAADWTGALVTLNRGRKNGHIDSGIARRRQVVLLGAEAFLLRLDAPEKAINFLDRALKIDTGFPPNAVLAARMEIAAGRNERARSIVQNAWKACPHPLLSAIWTELAKGKTIQSQHLKALASENPGHRESRILLAEAAISSGDWDDAEAIVTPLLSQEETDRLCLLMEMIARGRSDNEASTIWTRRAARCRSEEDWALATKNPDGISFKDADWARLVYSYGLEGIFIHPRRDDDGAIVHMARIAPPPATPQQQDGPDAEDDQSPTPPAPDYVPNR